MLAKWGKTKLHIRLMKNQTRSSIHILTDAAAPLFFLLPEFFRSLLLSFSPALDEHNPDISEWREDIGRVVRTALSQVHLVPIALRSLQWLSGSLLFHACLQYWYCSHGVVSMWEVCSFYSLPMTDQTLSSCVKFNWRSCRKCKSWDSARFDLMTPKFGGKSANL